MVVHTLLEGIGFLSNMPERSSFLMFYQKMGPNDRIRQKNSPGFIYFFVLVKSVQYGAFSPIFVGARSSMPLDVCISFRLIQNA